MMTTPDETAKTGTPVEFPDRPPPHRSDHGANPEAVMVGLHWPAAHLCWANLPLAAVGVSRKVRSAILLAAVFLLGLAGALSARADAGAEAMAVEPVELLTDEELAALVAPVALYPDDLLAIVLPASTFPLQVVLAARFLEARESAPNLEPDEVWDASIVALLNYPEVVALLDDDLSWTWELGEAVLVQQEDVVAAVADFREQAAVAGNLKSDDKQVVSVSEAGAIEITPVEREIIHVPYYDPEEVTTYQPTRVYHYYPRSYPVYYYPYPSGYYFSNGPFWGVSSAFSIGWHTRSLHWHHSGFHDHPYFGFSYYEPFYYRRPHIWLSYYNRDRLRRHDRRHHDDNRWRNDGRHGGPRPGHHPRRPGRESPPVSDGYSPGGRDRVEPPGGPTARVMDRSLVAMPGKQSSHIPVTTDPRTGKPLANKVGRGTDASTGPVRQAAASSQRSLRANTQRPGQSGQRTTSLGARSTETAAVTDRPRLNNRPRAPSRRPAATLGTPRSHERQPVAADQPTRAPARHLRQQPAKPTAARQAPRISTPIRKPSNRQGLTVAPRDIRSAPVRAPVKTISPRPQQHQRGIDPGTGAASEARTIRSRAAGRKPAKRAHNQMSRQSRQRPDAVQTTQARRYGAIISSPPQQRRAQSAPRTVSRSTVPAPRSANVGVGRAAVVPRSAPAQVRAPVAIQQAATRRSSIEQPRNERQAPRQASRSRPRD